MMDDNNVEFLDAVERSAIAHRLKRNTSSKDLSFTPQHQQLKNIIKSLIENWIELLEFAIRADSHRPPSAVQLAPQLVAALPVLHKKKQQKESMADRITEIYFIWREIARCPQVSNFLPHVRTKFGTVLENFTLSLVRVHTFCRAELEEERNTTKALKCEKKSGELFFCISILLFIHDICCLHLFVSSSLPRHWEEAALGYQGVLSEGGQAVPGLRKMRT